jgi:hypothetical protein
LLFRLDMFLSDTLQLSASCAKNQSRADLCIDLWLAKTAGRLSCLGATQPQCKDLLVIAHLGLGVVVVMARPNSTAGSYVPSGPAGSEALE